jgi:hypothetical protein
MHSATGGPILSVGYFAPNQGTLRQVGFANLLLATRLAWLQVWPFKINQQNGIPAFQGKPSLLSKFGYGIYFSEYCVPAEVLFFSLRRK